MGWETQGLYLVPNGLLPRTLDVDRDRAISSLVQTDPQGALGDGSVGGPPVGAGRGNGEPQGPAFAVTEGRDTDNADILGSLVGEDKDGNHTDRQERVWLLQVGDPELAAELVAQPEAEHLKVGREWAVVTPPHENDAAPVADEDGRLLEDNDEDDGGVGGSARPTPTPLPDGGPSDGRVVAERPDAEEVVTGGQAAESVATRLPPASDQKSKAKSVLDTLHAQRDTLSPLIRELCSQIEALRAAHPTATAMSPEGMRGSI